MEPDYFHEHVHHGVIFFCALYHFQWLSLISNFFLLCMGWVCRPNMVSVLWLPSHSIWIYILFISTFFLSIVMLIAIFVFYPDYTYRINVFGYICIAWICECSHPLSLSHKHTHACTHTLACLEAVAQGVFSILRKFSIQWFSKVHIWSCYNIRCSSTSNYHTWSDDEFANLAFFTNLVINTIFFPAYLILCRYIHLNWIHLLQDGLILPTDYCSSYTK